MCPRNRLLCDESIDPEAILRAQNHKSWSKIETNIYGYILRETNNVVKSRMFTWGSKSSVSNIFAVLISRWMIRFWHVSCRYSRPSAVPIAIMYLTSHSNFPLEPYNRTTNWKLKTEDLHNFLRSKIDQQPYHGEEMTSSHEATGEGQGASHLQPRPQSTWRCLDDLCEPLCLVQLESYWFSLLLFHSLIA